MSARITKNGSVSFELPQLVVTFDRPGESILLAARGLAEPTIRTLGFDVARSIRVCVGRGAGFVLQLELAHGETLDLCQAADREAIMRVAWLLGDLTRCAVEVEALDASPIGEAPSDNADEHTAPIPLIKIVPIADEADLDTLDTSLDRLLAEEDDASAVVMRYLVDDDEPTDPPSAEGRAVYELETPIDRPHSGPAPFAALVKEARAAERAASEPRGAARQEEIDWWQSFEIQTDLMQQLDDSDELSATPIDFPVRSPIPRGATPRARLPITDVARPARTPRPPSGVYRIAKDDDSNKSNPG